MYTRNLLSLYILKPTPSLSTELLGQLATPLRKRGRRIASFRRPPSSSSMDVDAIRSVWADNFAAESKHLHEIAPHAQHVALNVQYPGCFFSHTKGTNHYKLTAEERYDVIRDNVALLTPLQVGVAVRTDDGRRFVWEFNLREFDITSKNEARDPESIAYLAGRGVDFGRLPRDGIEGYRLRWLLNDSGLIRARPSWATFTGAYHVAYFVSMMTGEKLPDSVDDFMKAVRRLFGSSLYDVKRLARGHDRNCVGALSDIVKKLAVMPPDETIPKRNPAGTGSTLALMAFEELKQRLGPNTDKYRHLLCGLQTA